jgi:hypothetical protein
MIELSCWISSSETATAPEEPVVARPPVLSPVFPVVEELSADECEPKDMGMPFGFVSQMIA